MERVKIKHSFWKVAGLLVGIGLVFVLTGFHMLLYVIENYNITKPSDTWLRDKNVSIIISILTICFFGLAVLAGIWLLLKRRTVLIIDNRGFIVRSLLVSQFVPWVEVIEIKKTRMSTSNIFIGVKVKDLNKFDSFRRQSKSVRRRTLAGLRAGDPPIIISVIGSNEKVENAIIIMNEYLEKWRAKHTGLSPTLKEYGSRTF